MKNIIKIFILFFSVVFISGCSNNATNSNNSNTVQKIEQKTKIYTRDLGNGNGMEVILVYEGEDKLVRHQANRVLSYEGYSKNEIQSNIENEKKKNALDGVDLSVEFVDDKKFIRKVVVDYTKLDLQKAIDKGLLKDFVLSDDKKTVSLKRTEEYIKDQGLKEKVS